MKSGKWKAELCSVCVREEYTADFARFQADLAIYFVFSKNIILSIFEPERSNPHEVQQFPEE
jgi:hypothetical protein